MVAAQPTHSDPFCLPIGLRKRMVSSPRPKRVELQSGPDMGIEPGMEWPLWLEKKAIGKDDLEVFSIANSIPSPFRNSTAAPPLTASAKVKEVVALTSEVFGGSVTVEQSHDPEHPNHAWIVVVAQSTASRSAILKLEAEWARRISSLIPHCDGFRLRIKRKR